MNLDDLYKLTTGDPILSKSLKEINKKELLNKSHEESFEHEAEPFVFGVCGSIQADLQLFNDSTDDDADKLAQKLSYDNQLGQFAFLNYNMSGKVAAKVGAEVEFFEMGVEAEKEILLRYFTKHERSVQLKDALVNDLGNFKFIVSSAESLTELSDGEAVSMSCDGKLAIDSKVELSDVFTAALSKFSKLLKLSEALQVEVETGVSLTFKADIKDDFELLIQREEQAFKVSMYKSKVKSFSGGLGLNIGVKFDENSQNQINELLKKLLDGMEEGLYQELDDILNTVVENLTEEQIEALKAIAALFGIDPDQEVEKLKEQIADKRKVLEEEMIKVVKEKLELGLNFTYSRVKETESLFSATYSLEKFKSNLQAIRSFNLPKLLESRSENGVEITLYERLTKLDVKRSTKIGISLFGLSLSQDVSKNYSLDAHEVLKEGKILHKVTELEVGKTTVVKGTASKQSNSLQFGAAMDDYVEKGSLIKNSQFDYDFGLVWKKVDQGKTKSDELKRILDIAQCWGILSADDFRNKYVELESKLVKTKKKISYEMHTKVERGSFENFIDEIATLTPYNLAVILAESVPYAEVRGRTTLRERRTFYTDFWVEYLKNNPGTISLNKMEELLSEKFYGQGLPDLAAYESGDDGYSDYDKYTITNMVGKNLVTLQFESFQIAFKRLNNRFESSYKKAIAEKEFRKRLYKMRIQDEFCMRMLGRLIHNLAIINDSEDAVERALEIKLGGDDHTIILTR